MSDEEKEIFNNLKDYMQNQIDNGYHKFIYNDLGWDFKCIDCINIINKVLKQSKEIEELNKSDVSKEQSSMKYYNLYKELVDKIKAKIEELEKKQEDNRKSLYNAIKKSLYNAINNLCFKEIDKIWNRICINKVTRDILQSFLEEE